MTSIRKAKKEWKAKVNKDIRTWNVYREWMKMLKENKSLTRPMPLDEDQWSRELCAWWF